METNIIIKNRGDIGKKKHHLYTWLNFINWLLKTDWNAIFRAPKIKTFLGVGGKPPTITNPTYTNPCERLSAPFDLIFFGLQ